MQNAISLLQFKARTRNSICYHIMFIRLYMCLEQNKNYTNNNY